MIYVFEVMKIWYPINQAAIISNKNVKSNNEIWLVDSDFSPITFDYLFHLWVMISKTLTYKISLDGILFYAKTKQYETKLGILSKMKRKNPKCNMDTNLNDLKTFIGWFDFLIHIYFNYLAQSVVFKLSIASG